MIFDRHLQSAKPFAMRPLTSDLVMVDGPCQSAPIASRSDDRRERICRRHGCSVTKNIEKDHGPLSIWVRTIHKHGRHDTTYMLCQYTSLLSIHMYLLCFIPGHQPRISHLLRYSEQRSHTRLAHTKICHTRICNNMFLQKHEDTQLGCYILSNIFEIEETIL